LKSANRFRIIEDYSALWGTQYTIQELYINRNGKRKRWSTWCASSHPELPSSPITYSKLSEAQNVINREIKERGFIPHVVKEINAIKQDPDYIEAMKELEKELK
jgi:hypothetical protein